MANEIVPLFDLVRRHSVSSIFCCFSPTVNRKRFRCETSGMTTGGTTPMNGKKFVSPMINP